MVVTLNRWSLYAGGDITVQYNNVTVIILCECRSHNCSATNKQYTVPYHAHGQFKDGILRFKKSANFTSYISQLLNALNSMISLWH